MDDFNAGRMMKKISDEIDSQNSTENNFTFSLDLESLNEGCKN